MSEKCTYHDAGGGGPGILLVLEGPEILIAPRLGIGGAISGRSNMLLKAG